MVYIKKKKSFIRWNVQWFAIKPKMYKSLNTFYKQCSINKTIIGFKNVPFYTKIIDLDSFGEVQLLNSFNKGTSYEIRRAVRDGVTFGIEETPDQFTTFYNEFAKSKGLKMKYFNIDRDKHLITKALYNDSIIVMHLYLYDNQLKRVRLLYSASHFRIDNDSSKRALIGRANRFLHYRDMIFFKQQGFYIYDLGGYAYHTENIELNKINDFKDGFSGRLIQENDYYPLWIYYAIKILSILRK